MKPFLISLCILIDVMLCSNGISKEKPRQAPNTWSYNFYQVKADTSGWRKTSEVELRFLKMDSTGNQIKSIHFRFCQWPVDSGEYQVVGLKHRSNEVVIDAYDKDGSYVSKDCNAIFHVSKKGGKLNVWANNVMMEKVKSGRKGRGDSTLFSFNLTEY
jgi:hypothetical protein